MVESTARDTAKGLWESRAYDGIPELLKKLRDCGVKTATASSKPEQFIISILKKNNLYDYFDYVGASLLMKYAPIRRR